MSKKPPAAAPVAGRQHACSIRQRFPLRPPSLPSAPTKKTNLQCLPPILACNSSAARPGSQILGEIQFSCSLEQLRLSVRYLVHIKSLGKLCQSLFAVERGPDHYQGTKASALPLNRHIGPLEVLH